MGDQDATHLVDDQENGIAHIETAINDLPDVNEGSRSWHWRCSKCRTEPRGTPRDQLLDARDRWRRDWCQSCRRKTFMERA